MMERVPHRRILCGVPGYARVCLIALIFLMDALCPDTSVSGVYRHAVDSAGRSEPIRATVEMASADLVGGLSALHQPTHKGAVDISRPEGCFVGNLGRYVQVSTVL